MSKVSFRGGFSDRNGIKSENTEIQLTEFDERTRVQLHNAISEIFCDVYGQNPSPYQDNLQSFIIFVISQVYSETIDVSHTYYDSDAFSRINNTINSGTYDDILTVIEGIIQYWDNYLKQFNDYFNRFTNSYASDSLFDRINEVFKKEYVGYRFVNNIIVPISDPIEVTAIKDALSCKYDSVYDHLSKANKYLSDRASPDYENSIKESISAVEAICKIITGINGGDATLGKMLKKLDDNNIIVHPCLKSAFDKLYGYTNDANGIRHAGDLGAPGSTFEEAKFMLVACCAFINYLIELKSD